MSPPTASPRPRQTIVLFDGVCNLCNGLVRFLLARDTGQRLVFASLQSDAGQALLRQHRLPTDDFNSFVLIDNGGAHVRSTAALRLVRRLPAPWPLAYWLMVLPLPLRDAGYSWVAANRYRLFGQTRECMIPTPELRARFLS